MTLPDAFGLTRWFIKPTTQAQSEPTLTPDWISGVMTSWDPVSYTNLVVVGPNTYVNLPVVSPSGLTTGTVLLARVGGLYVVVGMLASARVSALLDPIRHARLRSDLSVPTTTMIDAGVLRFLLKDDTEYGLDGALFYNTTTSNDMRFAYIGPPNMAVKWSMSGTDNFTTNSVLHDVMTSYGDANGQTIQGGGIPLVCQPSGWFKTTDTPGILQLRVALGSGTTAGTLLQGSWLRISELGLGSGGTTYVKQYIATASRAYDDSGNPIGGTDQDNNVYQGSQNAHSSGALGNERSIIVFPGSTIRTDLTGATVLSAYLWLYCFMSENPNGSLTKPYLSTVTSVPATLAIGTDGPDTGSAQTWPIPGWYGSECLYQGAGDSLINQILAGGNSVIMPPTLFGFGGTGFRGYGFSTTYRPYLEITYVV